MRLYQTIYYADNGYTFTNFVTGTTDKEGNVPYGAEAAGQTFIGVPPLPGNIAGVVILEMLLH